MAVGPFLQRQSFMENLKITIIEQKRVVDLAGLEVKPAQTKLDEAYKSLKGIERLLEKQVCEIKKVKKEKEAQALDELLMMRHNRNPPERF